YFHEIGRNQRSLIFHWLGKLILLRKINRSAHRLPEQPFLERYLIYGKKRILHIFRDVGVANVLRQAAGTGEL
ncbi:MAG: hypothetical protein ACK5HT_10960, partial [Draconibacterium sp.]